MLYSKRRKNLRGGQRKRSNRRSYRTRMYSGGEPKVIWYWTNNTGSFQRYTDDECDRIENAYKYYLATGMDGGFSLTAKTPPISIYFGLMRQHDFNPYSVRHISCFSNKIKYFLRKTS